MHMFVNTFIYNQQSSNNRHSSEALEKVAVYEHALLEKVVVFEFVLSLCTNMHYYSHFVKQIGQQ